MTVTFLMFWLVPAATAGLGLIFMQWWSMKNPTCREDTTLTLSDVIKGTFFSLVPLINIFVTVGMIIYFMMEVAPRIVIFGGRR